MLLLRRQLPFRDYFYCFRADLSLFFYYILSCHHFIFQIHFYPNYEGLYKHIDKKYLPSEYGGEAESMYEKSRNWIKRINEDR